MKFFTYAFLYIIFVSGMMIIINEINTGTEYYENNTLERDYMIMDLLDNESKKS